MKKIILMKVQTNMVNEHLELKMMMNGDLGLSLNEEDAEEKENQETNNVNAALVDVNE